MAKGYPAKNAYYTKVAGDDVYYYFQDGTIDITSNYFDNGNTEFYRKRYPDSSEVIKYRTHSTVGGTQGNDTIYGNGSEQTSWGLNVPAKAAHLHGKAGNDTIISRDANDTILGNTGNDRIYGNAGNDSILGHDDNDFLDGGAGSDTIIGGAGNDFLLTGLLEANDSDILTGGTGSNTFLLGSAVPPTVNKPNPFDIDGNDLLLSMAGDISDLAFTVFGLDKVAKEIVPIVFDIAKAFTKAGQEKIETPETGAAYAQITDFNPRKDVVIIPIAAEGPSNVFMSKDSNGSSVLSFKYDSVEIGSDIIATLDFAPKEEIFGEGTQTLNHETVISIQESLQKNALFIDSNGASIGHSNLNSASNPQQPLANLNIDTSALENLGTNKFLILGAYSGQVFDNTNQDYQYGTDFGDVLAGYSLSSRGTIYHDPSRIVNDQLFGYNGNDIFYGGAGHDWLDGGQDSDTSSYVDSTAAIKVDLTNLKDYKDLNTGEILDQYAEVENDGFGYQDKLFDIENIIGSAFNDEIAGDGNANVLNGGSGTDTLRGRGGADTFWVGEGDIIKDFAAEDKLIIPVEDSNNLSFRYSNNNLTLLNSKGGADTTVAVLENISNNQVTNIVNNFQYQTYGESGVSSVNTGGVTIDTRILGTPNNDTLSGDGQANIFVSGKGDDNLTGNGGQDIFRLSGGKNTITDFTSSEDNIQIDVKEYYDSNSSVDFDATYSDTNNTLTISIAGQQAAILQNISQNQVVDALKQIEFIGAENNTIVINDEKISNKIGDSAGSQYVYGHAGNDNIVPFGGKDVVVGGDGDDFIGTSQQGDTAIGGTGADTFVLYQHGTNFSPDRILDFTPAEGDKIQIWKNHLDAISDNSDPSLGLNFTHSETNNALTITLGDRDLAILENISENQVGDALKQIEIFGSQTDNDGSEGSDDVLIGNSGNQLMRGLGGNDYLYGAGGNDTLRGGWQDDLLLGGDGNDYLQGFEDSDVLIGGKGADIFDFTHIFDAHSGVDKILDFTASEGDRIRINRFYYGFSSRSDLSFSEGQLSAKLANGDDKVIAILENPSGFDLNSHVDLVG